MVGKLPTANELSWKDQRLRNAMQSELPRKGLTFSEKEPDILIPSPKFDARV